MTPRVQWLIGAAIFIVGAVLFVSTSNFLLQTGGMITFLVGMWIAISARRRPSARDAIDDVDANTAAPIFPQLTFVNKPIFWNLLGVFLVGAALIGLGTHLIPMEPSIAAIIVGGFCLVAPVQGRRLRIPSAVSWLFIPIVAVVLLAFFYFMGPH